MRCVDKAALLLLVLVQPATASPSRKKTTASAHIWRSSLLFLPIKAYLTPSKLTSIGKVFITLGLVVL